MSIIVLLETERNIIINWKALIEGFFLMKAFAPFLSFPEIKCIKISKDSFKTKDKGV